MAAIREQDLHVVRDSEEFTVDSAAMSIVCPVQSGTSGRNPELSSLSPGLSLSHYHVIHYADVDQHQD